MNQHIPSPGAMESNDKRPLAADPRLARLRSQVALVHTLADHVERLTRFGEADGLGEQLIEEIARLGCRLLEAAASLAESPPSEDSGVFVRRPSPGARG